MSERYKVKDPEATYFMALTIVDWVDLFTRDRYVQHEQDWLWSSARDYCDGMQSEVHISRMY